MEIYGLDCRRQPGPFHIWPPLWPPPDRKTGGRGEPCPKRTVSQPSGRLENIELMGITQEILKTKELQVGITQNDSQLNPRLTQDNPS